MLEYLTVALLVFLPTATGFSRVLQKRGLDRKTILISLGLSLVLIVLFPLLVARFALPVVIGIYLLLIMAGILAISSDRGTVLLSRFSQAKVSGSEEVEASDPVVAVNEPAVTKPAGKGTAGLTGESVPVAPVYETEPATAVVEIVEEMASPESMVPEGTTCPGKPGYEPWEDEATEAGGPPLPGAEEPYITPESKETPVSEELPSKPEWPAGSVEDMLVQPMPEDGSAPESVTPVLNASVPEAGTVETVRDKENEDLEPGDTERKGEAKTAEDAEEDTVVGPGESRPETAPAQPGEEAVYLGIEKAFAAKFKGDYEKAAREFEHVWQLTDDPELVYLVGMEVVMLYREMGQYDEALRVLTLLSTSDLVHPARLVEVLREMEHLLTTRRLLHEIGLPDLPAARVPRLIRLKVMQALNDTINNFGEGS